MALKGLGDRWRVTCNPNLANDAPDFAEAKWKNMDPFTFQGSGACKRMERVRIRADQKVCAVPALSGTVAPSCILFVVSLEGARAEDGGYTVGRFARC